MLRFGNHVMESRLILGTGKFRSFEQMRACHEASGTQMVTVAIRRAQPGVSGAGNILDWIDRDRIALLPNTSGCYTAEEAVLTARLARELFGTTLLKLEVIGDPSTLYPDGEATLEAAGLLVKEGFTVLPYCSDDPVLCRKLEDVGCAAVMPLAAPIGSGLGVRNPYNIAIIREQVSVPLILDAGVGTASDCTLAMELGVDGLMVNTAVAGAQRPVEMAHAMRLATEAGYLAHGAGRITKKLHASASSPIEGVIFN
ncbi:MAG: thiazole synthase [Myxococcota bacterium]|nr:thiazole synthase [Myxococcota bacterium]